MVIWKDVNEVLPKEHCYVLVACAGGNTTTTFYSPHHEHFKIVYGDKSSYRRKYLGKYSRHFDLAHKYGYKIMFWTEIPEPPEEVYIDGEDT